MKSIMSVLKSGRFLALLALIALLLALWLVGPLIAIAGKVVFGTIMARMIATVIILVAVLGVVLWRTWRELKRSKELAASLLADERELAAAPADTAVDDDSSVKSEAAKMETDFRETVSALAGTPLGKDRKYLSQLPWYLIIGPPGAGKTMALMNAGLKFPAQRGKAASAMRGMGGTLRCDWWFSEEAVLIDSAGRYTTQDHDQDVDAGVWTSFLKNLKAKRPEQPLNGVIIALSALDFISNDKEALRQHAKSISDRIAELNETLGLKLPIYFWVTKCDRLAGFTNYFDNLQDRGRKQVWGYTLPLSEETDDTRILDGGGLKQRMRSLEWELARLVERVSLGAVDQLAAENDEERRAQLISFPQQFAALRDDILAMLRLPEAEGIVGVGTQFRGIYFTSATQEGAPVDRLIGRLAGGLASGASSAISQGTKKAYFLFDLVHDVVLGEAGVAGFDKQAARKRTLLHRGGVAAGILLILVSTGIWWAANRGQAAYLTTLKETAEGVASAAENAPTSRDADLNQILPHLDALRAAPYSLYTEEKASRHRAHGLSQVGTAETRLMNAYDRSLTDALLPRILAELEGEIAATENSPTAYELLRVYLMVGGQGPLDRDLVSSWAMEYSEGRSGLASLPDHVARLAEIAVAPQVLDDSLIRQTRRRLEDTSLAALALSRLLTEPDVASLPRWRMQDHTGPRGAQIFQLSTKEAVDGVAGAFTRTGYFDVVRARLSSLATTIANEAWVLGQETPTDNAAGADGLTGDIERLYLAAFVEQWRDYTRSIEIAPLNCDVDGDTPSNDCLDETAERILDVTGPAAPINTFLADFAAATDLRPATVDPGLVQGIRDTATVVSSTARRADSRARRFSVEGNAPRTPIDIVIDTYEPLRASLAADGEALAPIDRVLGLLSDYGTALEEAASERVDGPLKAKARGLADRFERAARDLPQPAKRLLTAFVSEGSSVISAQSLQQLAAAYQSDVQGTCRPALAGRYPFARGAEADLLLGDFERLYGPSGMIDTFFTEKIAPYVSTSTQPWSLSSEGESVGLDSDTVGVFERADKVKRKFFGSGTLGAAYSISVIGLDAKASSVRINLDGVTLINEHTPVRPLPAKWPGDLGDQGARIVFETTEGERKAESWPGAWGLFRMLDAARIVSSSAAEIVFEIGVDGVTATVHIKSTSIDNPFAVNTLRAASCAGAF